MSGHDFLVAVACWTGFAAAVTIGAWLIDRRRGSMTPVRPQQPQANVPSWASSLRCSVCANDYPPEADYIECPVCHEETWPTTYAEPMEADEATKLLRADQFERYLEDNNRV